MSGMPTNASDLDQVVSEAFASMAFAFATPLPGATMDRTDLVAVRLTLDAPERGMLWLLVDRATLTTLATDAWGVDGIGNDPDGTLFLAEVANVVAGQLLAARAPDADIRIGLPETASPDEVGHPEDLLWVYDLDGAKLTVAVRPAA